VSNGDKIGLFLVIVGLGLPAGKASARLAKETGVPALAIGAAAGAVGHGLAGEL
jgi:hypothetical protein